MQNLRTKCGVCVQNVEFAYKMWNLCAKCGICVQRFFYSTRNPLTYHGDLKVASSQAKIENSANTLKTKANKKSFTMLKCTCKGLQKSIGELKWSNQSPSHRDRALILDKRQ